MEQRGNEIYGQACADSFIAVIFGVDYNPKNSIDLKTSRINSLLKSDPKKKKFIQDRMLLDFVLRYFNLLNKEARIYFLSDFSSLSSDIRLAQELVENTSTIDSLFALNEWPEAKILLQKLHGDVLFMMMNNTSSSTDFVRVCSQLKGTGQYRLSIINAALEKLMQSQPKASDPKLITELFYIAFAIEDAIVSDPKVLTLTLPVEVLCRLIYILKKMSLLYVSAPNLGLFDERTGFYHNNGGIKELSKNANHMGFREGGFVRVILKILLLLIKYDKTENANTISILKFYVLQDKESKQKVKMLGKVLKPFKVKDQRKSIKYNLLDIALKCAPEKQKMHNLILDFVTSKVILSSPTLLESIKASKGGSPHKDKEKNIFESFGFTIFYLLASLTQLIYFELLGIQQYKEFPAQAELSRILKELSSPTWNKCTQKLAQLIQMLGSIVSYKYFGIEESEFSATLSAEFNKMLEFCQPRYKPYLPVAPELNLTVLYSFLDQIVEDKHSNTTLYLTEESVKSEELKADKPNDESLIKDIFMSDPESLKKFMKTRLIAMIELIKKANISTQSCVSFLMYSMSQLCYQTTQPNLLFLTTHNFKVIDTLIREKKCEVSNTFDIENEELMKMGKEFTKDFVEQIYEQFGFISIPKQKMERDEVRVELEGLIGAQFKKLKREQESEVGVWFDKNKDKRHKAMFVYISNKYQKIINSCLLYRRLRKHDLLFNFPNQEFVKLNLSRDGLERSQIMKRFDILEALEKGATETEKEKSDETKRFKLTYDYLRGFYWKKLMLCNLIRKHNPESDNKELRKQNFLACDFEHIIMRRVFGVVPAEPKPIKVEHVKSFPELAMSNTDKEPLMESVYQSEIHSSTSAPSSTPAFDECIPKKIKMFEVEMITIHGAIFGRLVINSVCISFKTEERRTGKYYKFGSTEYNRFDKKLNKKWKLDSVKEIVVKRYSLIRQAVEVYFENSKSILISFYSKGKRRQFITYFKEYITKMKKKEVEIVDAPEAFFKQKKFQEKWRDCEISNFEYLMLLNKYGGRSFNDLGQYPIFPWIIASYDHSKLDLKDKDVYRNLNLPIAAISTVKRRAAEEKLSILMQETDMDPFMFGSHYLAARSVLGYLLRLEPYASLLIQFEEGQDASARMFHVIRNAWKAVYVDVADNKELIPEFFYLPEMFANYNKCSFGIKKTDDGLKIKRRNTNIRVDQTIMPPWAKDNHNFIRKNFLALESNFTSQTLHHWVELVFGDKQQETRNHNRFKAICSEDFVSKNATKLNENQITEIQEFGSNPIKMFVEKHAPRNTKEYDNKTQLIIFPHENENENAFYSLSMLYEFKQPITYCAAFDRTVVSVLKDQSVNKSKEGDLNILKDNVLTMEKNKATLFPYWAVLEHEAIFFMCDAARCLVALEQGSYIVTCRHYDNSCRIINTANETVLHHLYFHKKSVFTVCTTSDNKFLCSGAADGTVAMWDIRNFKTSAPQVEWYACDHRLPIISMDASKELDLLVTASSDNIVSLRMISTGKFVRRFVPNLALKIKKPQKTGDSPGSKQEPQDKDKEKDKMKEKLPPTAKTSSSKRVGEDSKTPTTAPGAPDQFEDYFNKQRPPSASCYQPGQDKSTAHRFQTQEDVKAQSQADIMQERNLAIQTQFAIIQVRLSIRGYLIIIARLKHAKGAKRDLIIVYSINGEKINSVEAPGLINSIVFDESGYQFIVGGPNLLCRYDILSLEFHNLLLELRDSSKKKPVAFNPKDIITTLTLTKQEKYQKLIIGTTTGRLFAINHVQSFDETKLFHSLTDMVTPSK